MSETGSKGFELAGWAELDPGGAPGTDESEQERLNRNLNELLQELRIALPGVQVLFAFLLAVPFQRRFPETTDFQRSLFFVTLLFTAISTVLLMSPTAFHRITFRMQQKPRLIAVANRLTLAGLAFLAFAMIGAITLITDFLYSTTMTVIAAVLSLALFVVLWAVIPLHVRRLAQQD
ncbi:MAG: DUF6328 family protein [Actinomycetota bacterium]|nr:DUF6328 family protein [Actinomycetota bacterium]